MPSRTSPTVLRAIEDLDDASVAFFRRTAGIGWTIADCDRVDVVLNTLRREVAIRRARAQAELAVDADTDELTPEL